MSPDALHRLIQTAKAPALLHVLPPEHFERGHLPGARCACVYETAFLEHVSGLFPEKSTQIVVYGVDGMAAAVAMEKLKQSGYSAVEILDGGMKAWSESGYPLERENATPLEPVQEGTFSLDTEQSLVRWTGRNLFNHHEGMVRFQMGSIGLKNGELESATFDLDLRTIVCLDIPAGPMNTALIDHLWSEDFFDVRNHPVARFVSTRAEPIPGATLGAMNYIVDGELALRGETKPLRFPVVVAFNEEGLVGQAEIDLDRTVWGSLYGSGKFFEFLGKHVVNDLVHFHLKILAKRA